MTDSRFSKTVVDIKFYRDWLAKRELARQEQKEKPTYFVTISREFGCEGYALAQTLTEKLTEASEEQWSLFSRQMIEEMVANSEMEPSEVHEISEQRWSFRDWFVDALVPGYLKSHSSAVFEKMKKMILNLADKGHCVILGGGSQIITQRLDPKKFCGVHIRIVASYSWKVARVEKLFGQTREEAENTLRARQDTRDTFIADFTGLSSADPAMYNLIFNNERNSVEIMADTIVQYLKIQGAFD